MCLSEKQVRLGVCLRLGLCSLPRAWFLYEMMVIDMYMCLFLIKFTELQSFDSFEGYHLLSPVIFFILKGNGYSFTGR